MENSVVGGVTFSAVTVIVLIGIITYVCRFIGFWAIGFVEIGPRLRRSFELLPGCIAAASALPVAIDAGPLAMLALVIAFVTMRVVRFEIVAIVAALGLIALSRL